MARVHAGWTLRQSNPHPEPNCQKLHRVCTHGSEFGTTSDTLPASNWENDLPNDSPVGKLIVCVHTERDFSRQVPISVRAPHTTKPLRSGWEIKSLRMECGTPPPSAPRARKAAISHFRTAGHFPRTLLRSCTVGASTSLNRGTPPRDGPASEASSRAYTRGGLSGNRPPPPAPGCRKTRPTRTRGMRFPSARELPRPANGADAPAREAHAGSHAAGAHAGRSLRRAPRGPARIPPPAPRAAPLARGGCSYSFVNPSERVSRGDRARKRAC
jgi:hypothetical protein